MTRHPQHPVEDPTSTILLNLSQKLKQHSQRHSNVKRALQTELLIKKDNQNYKFGQIEAMRASELREIE